MWGADFARTGSEPGCAVPGAGTRQWKFPNRPIGRLRHGDCFESTKRRRGPSSASHDGGFRMADFLSAYSIQRWLESCPQGYLEDTDFGHAAGRGRARPPPRATRCCARTRSARTVQLVVGERCALAASSGLINAAPDEASKRFLATQTLDEARHVEVFTQRLFDLGVKKADLESTIKHVRQPEPGEVRRGPAREGRQEGLRRRRGRPEHRARGHGLQRLRDDARDEQGDEPEVRAHAVGHDRRRAAPRRLRREPHRLAASRSTPSKKPEIERMQKDMSYFMLATFADAFRGNQAVGRARPHRPGARPTRATRAPTSACWRPRRWSVCSPTRC